MCLQQVIIFTQWFVKRGPQTTKHNQKRTWHSPPPPIRLLHAGGLQFLSEPHTLHSSLPLPLITMVIITQPLKLLSTMHMHIQTYDTTLLSHCSLAKFHLRLTKLMNCWVDNFTLLVHYLFFCRCRGFFCWEWQWIVSWHRWKVCVSACACAEMDCFVVKCVCFVSGFLLEMILLTVYT